MVWFPRGTARVNGHLEAERFGYLRVRPDDRFGVGGLAANQERDDNAVQEQCAFHGHSNIPNVSQPRRS
jgi:hypothetical protein